MISHQNENVFILHQFQQKLKNIDKIVNLSIRQKQKKVAENYGYIQSTLKILKSLILQFTKKSIKIEQHLRDTYRINYLRQQTQHNMKKLQMCKILTENLLQLINKKKQSIQKYECQSNILRQALIKAKLQNIKKIANIEILENSHSKNIQRQYKQNRMQSFKQKMNQNRIITQSGQVNFHNPIDHLTKEKQELTTILCKKIVRKVEIQKLFRENYELFRQKLTIRQKKSNLQGLNGSLFFKLQQNSKISQNLQLTRVKKNNLSRRLLIYDTLKLKYQNEVKIQKKKQSQIQIQHHQFMSLTPIQILGLIQLKGGIFQLLKNKNSPFSNIQPQNKKYQEGKSKQNKKKHAKHTKYLQYILVSD